MTRYARQEILPQIGAKGQARIRATRVLIIGAGGLGVPVLQYLVGAGVGQITLIDPDRVETGNLHRQPIYAGFIGQPKAQAAAQVARALNPDVQVVPVVDWLTPANAPDLIAGADIIVDCADSFAASYTLSDLCRVAGKPLISASVLGLSGYVGGFCGGAPSLRAVFPDLPETVATCATAGVLGPVVGLFGTLQAQMVLAVALRMQPSPLGQLLCHDMQGFRSSGFRFDSAPEPDRIFPFIAATDLRPDDRIIDLRPTTEAPVPVHPRALRLMPEAIGATMPRADPHTRIVFACRSGLRAWRAAESLRPHWPGDIALMADPLSSTGLP